MANQSEMIKNNFIGYFSISYNCEANFIYIKFTSYIDTIIIEEIPLKLIFNLRNGVVKQQILKTDTNGCVELFNIDLSIIESLVITGELIDDEQPIVVLSSLISIIHPTKTINKLTLSYFIDEYYIELIGQLLDQNSKPIANKLINITKENYDIDGSQATLIAKTDSNGWYSLNTLFNNGDWEFEATIIDDQQQKLSSEVVNIIYRREELKFVTTLTTANIGSRYTGFAAYPSTFPIRSGSLNLISSNLWDEQFYIGRIVRDDNKFYFGFYPKGATSNGSFTLPKIFAIDNSNRGFIKGSSLIINDTEKYYIGAPSSYEYKCVYFDVNQGPANEMWKKYFADGKGNQTIKMEWIFWI